MQSNAQTSWKYAFLALVGVLVIAGAILFFNRGGVTGNVIRDGTGANLLDDDAVLGSANAPVTIVQFTDLQCPFCRKFETETFAQIKTNYIDTGKVKFVTRDFPLESIHPGALPAAMAAECVHEDAGDEAYYVYKEVITARQNERDSGSATGPVTKTISFTNADLVTWAQELGYDIESCLTSGKFRAEVQNDLADGQAAGVTGTPGFLIIDSSGTPTLISGAQPYAAFKSKLDAAA